VATPAIGFAASVINLTNPLAHFSFHVYQGITADGKSRNGRPTGLDQQVHLRHLRHV